MRKAAAGVIAALVVVGVAGIGAGVGLTRATPTPTAPTPQPVTGRVEQGALSDDVRLSCQVKRGTRAIASPAVKDGALPIVTKAPTGVKALQHGTVILEVAGRPVIALSGNFPLYRDLKEGDTGTDVLQLRQALRELGRSVAAKGAFDWSVRSALDGLYTSLGYEAPLVDKMTVALRDELVMLPAASVELAEGLPATGSRLGDALATIYVSTSHAECTGQRIAKAALGSKVTFSDRDVAGVLGPQLPVSAQAEGTARAWRVDLDGEGATRLTVGEEVSGSIELQAGSSADLYVPAAAVNGGASAAYVTVAAEPRRQVAVDLGMVADGFVVVRPKDASALKAGDPVLVGS